MTHVKQPITAERYLEARKALAESKGCSNRGLMEVVEREINDYTDFIQKQNDGVKVMKESYIQL